MNIIETVKTAPTVAAKLDAALTEARELELYMLENHEAMHPETAEARLNAELAACESTEQAQQIMASLSIVNSPAAKQFAVNVRTKALSLFEALKSGSLTDLLLAVEAELTSLRTEALASEAQFFAGHGVATQETEVSRRFARLKTEAQNLRAGMVPTATLGAHVPNPGNLEVFSWLGVSV